MSEIPGYTILRPLGQGGMATVYLALQQSLGREVALKILSPAFARDQTATDRFLREAHIAANLHHPNIVQIYDVGIHDGTPYMAMEYISGGSVAPNAGVPSDARAALRTVRDIAGALDYADLQGVVHRDIKPENILQKTDGSRVLSDFGIARTIASTLTRESDMVGTPHYMSPEHLRGKKVDGRSDLYSLGVVLYQLLSAELPYTGTDGWEIGMQHLSAPIPRLPAQFGHLQALVDGMMAKDPTARLQAGADVVRQIDALLAGGILTPTMPLPGPLPMPSGHVSVDAARMPDRTGLPEHPIRRKRVLLTLATLLIVGGAMTWLVLALQKHAAATGQTPAARLESVPLIRDKSIAVLPFENLSDDKGNAYFANGMQDMILTKLAGIGDLTVISRTSTEKYASHPDNLKVIAQQLGVATVLEGSVQKSGNQVLINVQLVDARTDNHLWAEAYPRTLDNVFDVEGEVAQKVADALKAKLTPAETASVAMAPTQNAAAYDLFLKAEYLSQQAYRSWDEATFLAADADYRQAIALDPDFALAYAGLAYGQMQRHWIVAPLTAAELADVKTSIDRALALAPVLPEAHLALGYYDYWGFRRYDAAIAEFRRTLQLEPSNVDALAGLAFIARRTGQWPQALSYLQSALLISPRDGHLRGEFGITHAILRRYEEANRQLKLALDIDPTNANSKDWLLFTRLFGFGDVAGARASYQAPPGWRIAAQNVYAGDVFLLINPRVYPDVFDRHFAEALHGWDSAPTDTPEERLTGQMARVAIMVIAGHRLQAQSKCEQLAPQLETELVRIPDSLSLLQQLSWVDVCLGRNPEAIEAAKRAATLLPTGKDAFFGAYQLVGLAQIDAQAGAPDEALHLIQQLLAMPAGGVMSIERLKLDPVWDPLRKDPRFAQLIADAEATQKAQARP